MLEENKLEVEVVRQGVERGFERSEETFFVGVGDRVEIGKADAPAHRQREVFVDDQVVFNETRGKLAVDDVAGDEFVAFVIGRHEII